MFTAEFARPYSGWVSTPSRGSTHSVAMSVLADSTVGPRGRALVLGANGFLGSHVVRALLDDGRTVRVMVRASSDTRSIDGLDVERVIGDALDPASLARAMEGCDVVYHSVVDTRAWLRDPAPLRRVNVEGLRASMDAALAAGVRRFVFTSTIGTIGLNPNGLATEDHAFDWADDAPAYILTRVEAEDLFFRYCREKGLPGVACCVASTFGANDYAPTPHGKLLYEAARGRIPVSWPGRFAIVGIGDAARALVFAEARGTVGERYIIAEKSIPFRELFTIGARALDRSASFPEVPLPLMYAGGYVGDALATLFRTSFKLSVKSVRLMHIMSDMDGAKARRELGWTPRAVEASIGEAMRFFERQAKA